MEHLSDTDLERYYLGMIPDGPELATLEEHLLICGECVDRAEEAARYVDTIRMRIIKRNWDLDTSRRRETLPDMGRYRGPYASLATRLRGLFQSAVPIRGPIYPSFHQASL